MYNKIYFIAEYRYKTKWCFCKTKYMSNVVNKSFTFDKEEIEIMVKDYYHRDECCPSFFKKRKRSSKFYCIKYIDISKVNMLYDSIYILIDLLNEDHKIFNTLVDSNNKITSDSLARCESLLIKKQLQKQSIAVGSYYINTLVIQ